MTLFMVLTKQKRRLTRGAVFVSRSLVRIAVVVPRMLILVRVDECQTMFKLTKPRLLYHPKYNCTDENKCGTDDNQVQSALTVHRLGPPSSLVERF